MPKMDRAALLKKESQATRKRFMADQRSAQKEQEKLDKEAKEEEARLAAERAKARTAAPGRFERAMQAGKANTTFGKAVEAEEDSDGADADYEDEPDEDELPRSSNSRTVESPKKESAAAKKKAAAARQLDDMQFLAAEEKAAIQRRIIDRLLRVFFVGFFVDMEGGKGAQSKTRQPSKDTGKEKKKKGGNKGNEASEGWSFAALLDKANIFTGPVLMLLFTVFLGLLVIAAEDFDPEAAQLAETNLYEVIGVSSDADVLTIRKAYKGLALSWHPDKNPGCEACATRFAKIGEAYEILNNPEKRKAYDQRRAPEGSLESVASVELTAEDFESIVLRSNDVWYVQIYESNSQMSKAFHPYWEDVSQSQQHVARFGRIDAYRQRKALRMLPQRVAMLPLVFRFARGKAPEIFTPDWMREDRSAQKLKRFVVQQMPRADQASDAQALKALLSAASERPRLVVSGPMAELRQLESGQSPTKAEQLVQVHRAAFIWQEFFDTTITANEVAFNAVKPEELGLKSGTEKGSWHVSLIPRKGGSARDGRSVPSLKHVGPLMQELVGPALADSAPFLTVRNFHQLCGMHNVRTLCLVFVDVADQGRLSAALKELDDSRRAFAEEIHEIQTGGEETPEELFHIQAVQVSTSSGRLPWLPVAVGSAFKSVWAEVDQAPVFVFEAETRRIGAVRTPSLRELFQQIAYDDLRLKELPEHASFARGLPDPEVPLLRELQHALQTPLGAIGAVLLAAVAIAVIPELSLMSTGMVVAVFGLLNLLFWPLLFRRSVSFFWCMASHSSFECQVGA